MCTTSGICVLLPEKVKLGYDLFFVCDEELRMRSFLQQLYPRHPLQGRAISSWEAIPWEDAKSIGRTSCGKWVRFKVKKNGNELGKTLTKLRRQRDKVEKFLCSPVHLFPDSEHHWTVFWRSKRLENPSNSEAHRLKL